MKSHNDVLHDWLIVDETLMNYIATYCYTVLHSLYLVVHFNILQCVHIIINFMLTFMVHLTQANGDSSVISSSVSMTS